ncbi:hypothetical protein EWM64_g10077 [Hericium alpestre]|uniref:Uncharacterized protein n=1 Tax=Hericium alpestre TaxID=135208 RepID=A0A4Y9ZGR9_9AGAM|nr:hypothetical protein EWM64_g10077 [Hericium alpestre]
MHSVEVNVKTSGPTFYFDYIVYDPSPSVSLSDSVILIDNTDPNISLSGSGWVNRYGNLWPLTSTGGDQMTLKFIGKSVTVLGIAPGELSGNQTTGTYTVDGSQPTSFVIPGHGGLAEFNQVYFTTPDFDPGPHTLVVTHQGNSNTAPFLLDLFYVANGAETLQASPSATNQNQATSGTLPSTSTSAFASASIGGHTITNSSTSSSASGGRPAAPQQRMPILGAQHP